MRKYFFFFFLSFLCFLSCKKKVEAETITEVKKSDKSSLVTHKISSKVNTPSLEKITAWKEYAVFNDFIKRYEKISPDEAFDNISELRELTFALEDSLNIDLFKTPAFKSRLHVLENEVLRLEDMSTIQAIKTEEVNLQIDKILLVYTSLNEKINTVFNREKFEKDIDLDDFFTMDKKELLKDEKPVKKPASGKKNLKKPK